MKPGTMIYLSGGKFYMAQDHKMPGGKMLSSALPALEPHAAK